MGGTLYLQQHLSGFCDTVLGTCISLIREVRTHRQAGRRPQPIARSSDFWPRAFLVDSWSLRLVAGRGMEPGSFLRVDLHIGLPVSPRPQPFWQHSLAHGCFWYPNTPSDGSEGTDLPYSQRPQGSEGYPGIRWPLLRESGGETESYRDGIRPGPKS